jgi:transposase-like protein
MSKPKKVEGTLIRSLIVRPIVTGLSVTCPECRVAHTEKVSQFSPHVEINAYECPSCHFEYMFTPPIKVGGTKRRYL